MSHYFILTNEINVKKNVPVNSETPLKNIIRICQDRKSRNYERAWLEFILRFNLHVYKNVNYACLKWKINPKISSQIKDIVNDIVCVIYKNLHKDIIHFKKTDSENSFKAWLTTICHRTVSKEMEKFIQNIWQDIEIDFSDTPKETQWELFDFIKRSLSTNSEKKVNAHRDLLIFMLYTWANFSATDLKQFGCLSDIGDRVVDMVVMRSRQKLNNQDITERI